MTATRDRALGLVPPATHVVIDPEGLGDLVVALRADGRTVIGPVVRDNAVTYAEIEGIDDLPRGVGDVQDSATYRLRERADGALFGYASAAQSMKPWLFPARQLLWRGHRTQDAFTVEAPEPEPRRLALFGVRGCDLRAIAVHDRVLADPARPAADAHYAAARAEVLIVAVACAEPSGTCFCASMGTGPHPGEGADLVLTELDVTGDHRFLVEVVTESGAAVLARVPGHLADPADVAAAEQVTEAATAHMGRTMPLDGLRERLYAAAEDPHWDDVAARCLACTNCTLVCPTCFCTGVQDATDLSGDRTERWRVWDSCFTAGFSYIHGGSVRESTRARYRQWMTHKLAAWQDQFGSPGCVGCGRCITWCPAAIDITEEASALRAVASRQE